MGVPRQAPRRRGGAALIGVGLVLFAWALAWMKRRSVQRVPWALRWYQASAACLGVGALLGVLMATATPWAHGSLLGASTGMFSLLSGC